MRYSYLVSLLSLLLSLVGCTNGDKNGNDVPRSKWISNVYAYRPAPGQFINTSLGDINAPTSIVGKKGLVSLGGYGGYIIFGFDHSVDNIEGVDFVIHGNAFEGSSEPAAVMVSVDANANGKPDDEWYELRGSEYDRALKGYEVTYKRPATTDKAVDIQWNDNRGGSGILAINTFHSQCYFPLFPDSGNGDLKLSGNRVEHKPLFENDMWVWTALEGGYADNFSQDYTSVIGGDQDTANSNKFDISTAVNSAGASVQLAKIDFVKVYNCVLEQSGSLGEMSSEICGAISLSGGR